MEVLVRLFFAIIAIIVISYTINKIRGHSDVLHESDRAQKKKETKLNRCQKEAKKE